MKKIFLIFVIFIVNLFAQGISVVPISSKSINYKEQLFSNYYKLVQINDRNIQKYKIKCKNYPDLIELKLNKYRAKHYINKNKPICKKDIYIPVSKKIKFNFGLLEIERDGVIIKETDTYIKIKNLNGKIEKIYKNGHKR